MKSVERQTESYLFDNSKGRSRAFPFYELSIHEWVVYETTYPKYLIDFNRRDQPLIQDLTEKLNSGKALEEIVSTLGVFLGREWTTEHNIEGPPVPKSQQKETIELILLDDLGDFFIDLTIIATNEVDLNVLLTNEKLFDTYLSQDKNGFLGLESAYVDNLENLDIILKLVFNTKVELIELASIEGKHL
jgi:hypothetical protein